ncbi:hypothetical protein [Streptomyces sp. KR55]|uniref:hypothetical protein n=1 Tax=Streptomyces sp. KR55 TaxID=3457425 RepID=UPI003FCF3B3C
MASDASLSAYAREAIFPTVVGDVGFGAKGEWSEPRVLQVQFQGLSGHEVGQFRNGSRQTVVSPRESSSGKLIFPYAEALTAE